MSSKKIIICDDDEAISDMMKIMLEGIGFEVKILTSGKAIYKNVKDYCPQLILIDIWMPGIDGKEAIKLLKRESGTKDIPIIVISALDKNEVINIVKVVGANGYLLKPFNMEDLLSTARKFAV